MKRVSLENVQARLADYVDASVQQPVLILRDGEPVPMLVGLERHAKRAQVKPRDVLKRAWKDYEDHGGIPHEEFWNDLAKSGNQPAVSPPKGQRSR
jgi:antitoxin (DNA-binding transcriptional repressor) of toxin-antitoxin stability system